MTNDRGDPSGLSLVIGAWSLVIRASTPSPVTERRSGVCLRLLERAHGDEDGFLTGGQDFLQFLLGGLEVGLGLGAGLAERGELGVDLVGGGVLVLQDGVQLGRRLGDGRRRLVAAAASGVVAAAAGAAPAAAEAAAA